jgi:CheY-like chemotaxis protein
MLRQACEGVSRESAGPDGSSCEVSYALLDGDANWAPESCGDEPDALPAESRLVGTLNGRRLRQVVVALLSNAVRFNVHGGRVRVVTGLRRQREPVSTTSATNAMSTASSSASNGIALRPQEDSGGAPIELVVCVSDTGPGLPQSVVERVESDVWSPSEADESGSGLGLVLARRLVTLMGGRLTMVSPTGEAGGTRCVVAVPVERGEVRLPARAVVVEADPAVECESKEAASEGSVAVDVRDGEADHATAVEMSDIQPPVRRDPTGWRVLVLDDVPLNRRVVKRILARGPFAPLKLEFVEMATAEEARDELLGAGRPLRVDMAVVDENMSSAGGIMLGHELVRLLREDERRRRVPPELRMLIVGATGNVTAEDVARFEAAGMDFVFGKPLPPSDEMFARLRGTGRF